MSLLLTACNKEIKVVQNTDNTSLLGKWDIKTVFGSYYLNDTLWKHTYESAPFTPDKPYRDFAELTFAKDSLFVLNADSTEEKYRYNVVGAKIILNYADTLPFQMSNITLRLQQVNLYTDLIGFHRDTINYSFTKK